MIVDPPPGVTGVINGTRLQHQAFTSLKTAISHVVSEIGILRHSMYVRGTPEIDALAGIARRAEVTSTRLNHCAL